jgi:hypothetical protein
MRHAGPLTAWSLIGSRSRDPIIFWQGAGSGNPATSYWTEVTWPRVAHEPQPARDGECLP